MKYVGIDLHKKTISACVVVKEYERRQVAARKRLACKDESAIAAWFRELGPFEVVVEATSSYEWFVKLVEPLAHRVLLAHPKKLRVIAESKRKSDKLDAQVLAEFLASDEIPLAYRPSPRVRLAEVACSVRGPGSPRVQTCCPVRRGARAPFARSAGWTGRPRDSLGCFAFGKCIGVVGGVGARARSSEACDTTQCGVGALNDDS